MKKRQVNFELLRILCMYMIVVGHCLFHGRVTAKLGYGTVNYFLSYLIQSFSVVHVNCFVMLAGYFAIDREFQSGRILRLWRQVAFYSMMICLVWGCWKGVTGRDVLTAVLPISSRNYWFASVYMGLVLMMPFAGMLTARLSRRQYRYLLILLGLFFSVNHMIFRADTYGIFTGRDLSWFLFLALLAGYVKLHTRQERRYFWYGLGGYVLASLGVLASVYLSVELHLEDMGYFLNYNSPLALAATVSLFVCVKNMPWREGCLDNVIRKTAGAAFGVYLIHDNYLIRYAVWDLFRASRVARTHWAVIYAAMAGAVVYGVCTCVELARQWLFQEAGRRYERTALYKKEQELLKRADELFLPGEHEIPGEE